MAKWNLKGERMDIKDVLVRLNDIIHAKDPKVEAVRFKRDLIFKSSEEK
tara:strand:+ start:287 stop:433 length:147 start_codon:yes stop_codon:yes gene_type:complete